MRVLARFEAMPARQRQQLLLACMDWAVRHWRPASRRVTPFDRPCFKLAQAPEALRGDEHGCVEQLEGFFFKPLRPGP